jgi:PAS domain S-box-containing protein
MDSVAELQAALRQSQAREARYRLLLEHSADVGWMVELFPGAQGRLSYLSPAAARQFGYALDGPDIATLAGVLLADLPARLAAHAQGQARVQREAELQHGSGEGSLIPIEIDSTLILDEHGAPQALLGVLRDLSPRRELAAQQKKFASMLSHEFRTPLSTIDGAVQRLEMTGAHHDEGTRKRYRKIQTAVDRMLEMLDEYLSPERMASIGRERQPDEAAPAALLEAAADKARTRRSRISVRDGGLPSGIRCDPAGLRLCLDILLDNALKYTPDDTPVELLGKMAGEGGIELLVRDHGAGLPPDELARIFEKSFRGSNAGGVPGSGLGLYMAQAVVDVHGGTLVAKNFGFGNPSESGMEFRIWLPISAPAGKSLAYPDGNSDNSLTQAGSSGHPAQ